MKRKIFTALLAVGIVFSVSSASMASAAPPACKPGFVNHLCVW